MWVGVLGGDWKKCAGISSQFLIGISIVLFGWTGVLHEMIDILGFTGVLHVWIDMADFESVFVSLLELSGRETFIWLSKIIPDS